MPWPTCRVLARQSLASARHRSAWRQHRRFRKCEPQGRPSLGGLFRAASPLLWRRFVTSSFFVHRLSRKRGCGKKSEEKLPYSSVSCSFFQKNEDVAKIRLQNCHILENVTRAVKKTRIWQTRGQELPHPRFCARLPPSWVVRRSGLVCCGRAVPASLQPVQDCGDWLHRPSSFLQTDMIFILPETSLRGGRAIRKGESHG